MLTAGDIARDLALPLPPGHEGRAFGRVAVDSRLVEQGDLFVALPGARTDGHRFIRDALARGATGILARGWPEDLSSTERAQGVLFAVADPAAALRRLAAARLARSAVRTVGVTGSVGKTSTKEAIAALLATRCHVLKSRGNLNTDIGMPMILLELAPEHQYAVLEMGMYGLGDIALLCDLARPSLGVVTNVGPVHLERLGTIENIARAKAELVEALPASGTAFLNADDVRVAAMAERAQGRVVTFGFDEAAAVRATKVAVHGLDGISFCLCWEGRSAPVRTPLLGRHNVYSALAAAAVALAEGWALEETAAALAAIQVESRVRVRTAAGGATVLDDSYNASPASVKAALDLLAATPGRRVALLGDMYELGSYEQAGHEEVGVYAAAHADILLTIGPRAETIACAARRAGLGDVRILPDKPAAVAALLALSQPGTCMLIKASRGMALDEVADALCARPQDS